MGEPTYVSIMAGNNIVASISRSGIGRADIREHQEGYAFGASIFRSGIDSMPIYMSITYQAW